MDLGTIARKLAKEGSGGYTDHKEFAADVQLVFDNAMKYNGPVSCTVLFNGNMMKNYGLLMRFNSAVYDEERWDTRKNNNIPGYVSMVHS